MVTVVGTDAAGTTVTDNDDAVVTLFDATVPQIDLVKTADPLTRVVPGGDFTFNLVVTNPGTIPVTITALVDDVYGNIGSPAFNGTCDDLIGDVLAPAAGSAACSFVGPFTNATPASQTDVVTVTGTGNGADGDRRRRRHRDPDCAASRRRSQSTRPHRRSAGRFPAVTSPSRWSSATRAPCR